MTPPTDRFLYRAWIVARIAKLYNFGMAGIATLTATQWLLSVHRPLTLEDWISIARSLPHWLGQEMVVYGQEIAPTYLFTICCCIVGWVISFAVQTSIEREWQKREREG